MCPFLAGDLQRVDLWVSQGVALGVGVATLACASVRYCHKESGRRSLARSLLRATVSDRVTECDCWSDPQPHAAFWETSEEP